MTRSDPSDGILQSLPARHGHFRLESGYHTDLWLSLDALFLDPQVLAPRVAALADLLRPYDASAICGPLLGGAFLAQAVAARLGVRFYYCQPAPPATEDGLFAAEYRLPPDLRRTAGRETFAVVDDVISAGSSVRATAAALGSSGARTVVVGSLLLLGDAATEHFASLGIPVVALGKREFNLWAPDECPRCQAGVPLEDPAAGS